MSRKTLSTLFLFGLIFLSSTLAPKVFAGEWANVGTANFTSNTAIGPSITLDSSDNSYVAFVDADNSYAITVMKFNGTNWSILGAAGFSGSSPMDNMPMAINPSTGNVYIAYGDTGNANKATVKMYDGANWVTVGAAGFSAGTASYISMAFDSLGVPYVAYEDGGTSNKVTVKKYSGGAWSTVGTAGISTGTAYYTSIDLDSSNNPYVAYSDIANSYKVTLMRYNGTIWSAVGSAGFTAGTFDAFTSLKLDGSDIPYVGFRDSDNALKATVMKYTGGAWGTVGTAGFSAGTASDLAMDLDSSNTPYVAYMDSANSNKVTVMKYSGGAWGLVGTAGFTNALPTGLTVESLGMQLDTSGNPHVAYQEAVSGKVTSMSYLPNTAPVLSSATAVAPNGNGDVNVSVVVNDDDDDALTVSYYYELGACSSYGSQPAPTLRSASDGAGSVTVSSGTATSVATTSADNTLVAVWDTVADFGDTRGDYCVYIIANDGTVDSNEVSATVTISGSGGGSDDDEIVQEAAVGEDVSENGEDLDGDHQEDATTQDPDTDSQETSIEQADNISEEANTETETGNQSSDDDNQPIPESFTDTAGTWAQSYIEKLRESGIVVGTAESTKTVNGELVAAFEPDTVVTRGQLVKMAMKAFGYSVQKFDKTSFMDVPTSHDFAMYIESAKQAGYIGGYSDGTFRPDEAVNRAEALVIILKFSGLDLKSEGKIDFPDVASRAWYRDILAYAVEHKIISGYENGNFGPGDSLTRSQAAKILVLVMESL